MRIGRFQVIEPLAGQGARRVLAAYDPRLDRKVAIELGAAQDDDAARVRRRQRARAMARLQHANVVRVHEVGEHEGEPFVATDFVHGGTLEDWCREHPPGTRERFAALLDLVIQAARGLAAAHAASVIGLPLGPGDMLVDADGRLRLRGWSMAGAVATGGEPGGRETGVQEPDVHEADARDDQRALCRTFWEAALGSAAPELGSTDRAGKARADAPASSHADVPAWFVATLRRGLAWDPRDRFPHVDALRAALERGRDGRRWRWWVPTGVAAAVIAGLVASRPSAQVGCRAPDDAPSQAWESRRAALEQRFAASGIERGRSRALHTTRRLDQFVAQWDAERLAACIEAGDGDPLADARLACLDRGATGFRVVLEEIERLESARLGSASTLTLSLPDLRECREAEPARAGMDYDNASVREASRRLAEASTLINLRRAAKAEEIVATLEAEGWAGSPGVESHGRLVLAKVAYSRGDYARMRAQAVASLRAAELGGDAAVTAAAWAELASAELARVHLDDAAFAAERVESLATSLGDRLILADAKALMGGVEVNRGNHEQAVAAYEVAERHIRAELGDEHRRLAALYQDFVPALVIAGRLGQAVEVARKSVAMFETLVGEDSLLTVRARGVLGLALADFGAREEAIVELERALEGLVANPDASPHDRFIMGLKRVEQLGQLGRGDEALAAVAELRAPPGDGEAELALTLTRGTVLLESGRAAEAAAVYEALLAKPKDDDSYAFGINRAVTQANLAIALARSGRAEEAVAMIEPTIEAYEALGMPPTRLGGVWLEFVAVYRAAGRLREARNAAARGVAALERGDATPEALAKARAELAELEAAVREQEATQ